MTLLVCTWPHSAASMSRSLCSRILFASSHSWVRSLDERTKPWDTKRDQSGGDTGGASRSAQFTSRSATGATSMTRPSTSWRATTDTWQEWRTTPSNLASLSTTTSLLSQRMQFTRGFCKAYTTWWSKIIRLCQFIRSWLTLPMIPLRCSQPLPKIILQTYLHRKIRLRDQG